MNLFLQIKQHILDTISSNFSPSEKQTNNIVVELNADKGSHFGDIACNAAMLLAKDLSKNPRDLANEIKPKLLEENFLNPLIEKIEIAGPGFLNIFLNQKTWQQIANELFSLQQDFFKPNLKNPKKYLIEFVSANPTGPLHLGHGRGGIIGDILSRVLKFIGHKVEKEFYINDVGNQIVLLGQSLKIRCQQELGEEVKLPENCYQGEYLIDLAKECIKQQGNQILEKEDKFFEDFAKKKLLEIIKNDLQDYNVDFDNWFSEKSLHDDSSVQKALDLLKDKKLIYEKDDALWFKSSQFGDDKDRVVKKQDGNLTYIAADIAYHKNKFDRGFDILIDILGQDHHSYAKRLKATMEALEFDPNNLQIILYQLVSIKHGSSAIKMSKRAGSFTTLKEIIDTVNCDVARFFYLNRKAEAHLDFDLDIAIKTTEENPVYYIQYAYVRTNSLLKKASKDHKEFKDLFKNLSQKSFAQYIEGLDGDEILLLKKIISLESILKTIARTYQTHLLAYYAFDLAKQFHNFYAKNRIINPSEIETSKRRLLLVKLYAQSLAMCLDLLGLSKPKKM